MAWDLFGADPPLVPVHGTPTWSFFWREVFPPPARDFTVHALDLPGYGDSPPPWIGQNRRRCVWPPARRQLPA